MNININTDAVVAYTNKLEKLSKTAMPNVVRQTLNKAALDVKQVTMPKSAKDSFTIRQSNFFKANSKVIFASGNNINSMQSRIGFSENTIKYDTYKKNMSVENLEKQEEGGTIKGMAFKPNKEARVGGNHSKSIRPNQRLKDIKNVVNAESVKFKGSKRSKKQRFVRAAIKAFDLYGNDAYVLGNKYKGDRQTLSRIDDISPTGVNGTGIKIKRTPVYTYEKGRHLDVKGTRFMKRASHETTMKIEEIYIELARKRLMK
jgi:hypothetical protein